MIDEKFKQRVSAHATAIGKAVKATDSDERRYAAMYLFGVCFCSPASMDALRQALVSSTQLHDAVLAAATEIESSREEERQMDEFLKEIPSGDSG